MPLGRLIARSKDAAAIFLVLGLTACGSHSQLIGGTYTEFRTKTTTPPQAAPKSLVVAYGMSSAVPSDFAVGFRQHLSDRFSACGVTVAFQPVAANYTPRVRLDMPGVGYDLSDDQKLMLKNAKEKLDQKVKETNSSYGLLMVEKDRIYYGIIPTTTAIGKVPSILHYELALHEYASGNVPYAGEVVVGLSNPNTFNDPLPVSAAFFADHLLIDLADKGVLPGCRPPVK